MKVLLLNILALCLLPQSWAMPASNEQPGTSNLSDSWLFQSAKLFYDVHSRSVKPRKLSHSDLLKLQNDLNRLLDGVLAIHRASVEETSKEFGTNFDPTPKASVVLIDIPYPGQTSPYAGSVVDLTSRNLVVNIDVALLRTIFQSAVIDAAKSHRPPTKEELKSAKNTVVGLWDDNDSHNACSDSDCLKSFLTFVSVVDSGTYTGRAQLYAQLASTQVDARYSGTLFFILAHELGHFLFGHHSHPCDAPKCKIFKADELQADRFAAYLLTLRTGLTSGAAIGLGFDQYTGASNYIGFPQFFEKAYPRLGFDSQTAQSLCACDYPPASEREQNALDIANTAIKRVPVIQAEAAKIRLSEQIQMIRQKYQNTSEPPGNVSQSAIGQSLYPVEVGSKIGYMNKSGAIVIRPKFDNGDQFSEGLALVDFNGDMHHLDRGFIDMSGRALFHVNFPENAAYNSTNLFPTKVGAFRQRRSLVEIRKGLYTYYGFIDKSGKFVIDPDFSDAEDFSEGVAVVMISSEIDFGTEEFGYIKPTGQFAIEPQFKWARSFHEDLAGVENSSDEWGYINHAGSVQIPYQFDKVWDFHGCCALVEKNGERFYINKSGAAVSNKFATGLDFSEQVAAINVGGQHDENSPLPEYVKGGKWGYIDASSASKIEPKYGCAHPFSDGLAAVNSTGKSAGGYCDGGKWSFIDHDGVEVFPAKFDDVIRDFQDGIAMVKSGTQTGYIDKAGQFIIPK